MDPSQTAVFNELTRCLTGARHLAAWPRPDAADAYPEALALKLQEAQWALAGYARIDVADRYRLLQSQGLYGPLPAAVRRALGLPCKPTASSGSAPAPVSPTVAHATHLWRDVVADLQQLGAHDVSAGPQASIDALRRAERTGNYSEQYCCTYRLFALKPWLRAGGAPALVAPIRALLGPAFVAAVEHEDAPLQACLWGTKLFKRAEPEQITPAHVRGVAVLVHRYLLLETNAAQKLHVHQRAADITAIVHLWGAMQHKLAALCDAARGALLDAGTPSLRQDLFDAAAELTRLYAAVRPLTQSLPQLHIAADLQPKEKSALGVAPAQPRASLEDYRPLPAIFSELQGAMAAASRGIFVPGRNFCLTSIPGVGKSTFVEVIQHHFCRDSRNNAALWGAPVNTVRIRATDIFDCVYAASSKKLMALFSQIHRETRARGCVTLLVIDEFDALVGSSGNEQDETVGVIRAFQQWADNTHTDANKSANVFILATTNHPERIDPAVLSRFTCYPFAAANSLNAKAIAALWQGTPWLRLVIFQNHGLPEITTENLSMALARDLPIRTVERICDEIKRRHLALPTAAATHAALFAFCQAMLAAQQAHRARHRPAPGAAPIFVEVAHSAYLLALPWQDLARLRADDQAPFASPFGCISYRATPTQIDFVMVAQGGLHLISLQPQLQQRLMQTFKIEAAVHLGDDQARGRVITHVGDRALRLNCEIDPGLSTLCQIVLPLGDIDSALLPTETLQAATLALEIGLPAPAVAAVDDLFARPYAANFG